MPRKNKERQKLPPRSASTRLAFNDPMVRSWSRTPWLPLVVVASAIASGNDVQDRIANDLAMGRPIVIHIVVSLCDNKYQGIVPVPKALGDGQNPNANLYWGAGFGVRTYFQKSGWTPLKRDASPTPQILERVILTKELPRGATRARVYIVAEAWDGREIRSAIYRFLNIAAGNAEEALSFDTKGRSIALATGGAAHLVAFVGHNGLMDFNIPANPPANRNARPRSSIVLACGSLSFFQQRLAEGGSQPLLLTKGLMAPEAYSLEAAIASWIAGKSNQDVLISAATAYDKFQKCGLRAATNLFFTGH